MLQGMLDQADAMGATVIRRPLHETTGGGACAWVDGHPIVYIDPRMTHDDQAVVLAHELAHARRGVTYPQTMPATWQAVVAREEQACDTLAATMLVDLDQLRETMVACDNFGYAPTVAELAADHMVPAWVMELAVAAIVRAEGIQQAA